MSDPSLCKVCNIGIMIFIPTSFVGKRYALQCTHCLATGAFGFAEDRQTAETRISEMENERNLALDLIKEKGRRMSGLLISLHQIRTSAIDENDAGTRDFVDKIFSTLTPDEQDKYEQRFGEMLAALPSRPHRAPHGLQALGLFFVRLGHSLMQGGKGE